MKRLSFPNPDRPTFWPGEEHHLRTSLQIGDRVRTMNDYLCVVVAFNNTWSSVRCGRLVHLAPIGPSFANDRACSWESKLRPAEASDVFGRHPHFPDCECGIDVPRVSAVGWVLGPASWNTEPYKAVAA